MPQLRNRKKAHFAEQKLKQMEGATENRMSGVTSQEEGNLANKRATFSRKLRSFDHSKDKDALYTQKTPSAHSAFPKLSLAVGLKTVTKQPLVSTCGLSMNFSRLSPCMS